MSENNRKKLDRRSFVGTSMMGAAGLAIMPGVLKASSSVPSPAPADVKQIGRAHV